MHSPHVIEVIAAGIDPETDIPWMAMELLAGMDLEDTMKDTGQLAPERCRRVLAQLGSVLRVAHLAEPDAVLHLDLKPDNIYLAQTGLAGDAAEIVKVLDFGISRLLAPGRTFTINHTPGGTPAWMAPEQVSSGAPLRPQTDVWSVGLIAFWLFTGANYWRTVRRRGSIPELLAEMLVGDLDPATLRAAEVAHARSLPLGFDPWFARCVHRDPRARYSKGRDAIDALLLLLPRPQVGGANTGTVVFPGAGSIPVEMNPRWHFEQAMAHERAGRWDLARASLDAALNLDATRVECRIARSRARRMLGDPLGARVDADAALALDPSNVAARDAMGRARAALGEWANAALDFTAVLMRDPSRADLYAARAKCFVRLEMPVEARIDATRAAEIEPGVWPTLALE